MGIASLTTASSRLLKLLKFTTIKNYLSGAKSWVGEHMGDTAAFSSQELLTLTKGFPKKIPAHTFKGWAPFLAPRQSYYWFYGLFCTFGRQALYIDRFPHVSTSQQPSVPYFIILGWPSHPPRQTPEDLKCRASCLCFDYQDQVWSKPSPHDSALERWPCLLPGPGMAEICYSEQTLPSGSWFRHGQPSSSNYNTTSGDYEDSASELSRNKCSKGYSPFAPTRRGTTGKELRCPFRFHHRRGMWKSRSA